MSERHRCAWVGSDSLMVAYHDQEWGVPEWDGRKLWECLMLEGFQAGLSWATILKRREGFRRAFEGFDPSSVAKYTEADVQRLLGDDGIIRSRAKIVATILGAQAYLEIESSGKGFSELCWSFSEGRPLVRLDSKVATQTPLSATISAELKRRGFKFVGPVIVYAWMQAVGIVEDHDLTCFQKSTVLTGNVEF